MDGAVADARVNHSPRFKSWNKQIYEKWACSRRDCGLAGGQGQEKVGDKVQAKKHASENNSIQDTVVGHLTVWLWARD